MNIYTSCVSFWQQVKCSIVKNEPLFDVPDLPVAEVPKPPPPRNDITNRFWAMVDTYCQEMTAEDIKVRMLHAENEDMGTNFVLKQ